jgi:hypothetical protein
MYKIRNPYICAVPDAGIQGNLEFASLASSVGGRVGSVSALP